MDQEIVYYAQVLWIIAMPVLIALIVKFALRVFITLVLLELLHALNAQQDVLHATMPLIVQIANQNII